MKNQNGQVNQFDGWLINLIAWKHLKIAIDNFFVYFANFDVLAECEFWISRRANQRKQEKKL